MRIYIFWGHERLTDRSISKRMSVLSLVVAFESEWKHYTSSQSDKKTLAFEYDSASELPIKVIHLNFALSIWRVIFISFT